MADEGGRGINVLPAAEEKHFGGLGDTFGVGRHLGKLVVEADGDGGGERRTKRGEEKTDQTTHSLTLDNQNCSVNL